MVLWGISVLGCQKVPRKAPPSFQQGSTKVSPRFHLVLWSRSVLGCQKVLRKVQGSNKVPPRFHQGSIWFWGADPSAAKRFCGRSKVPTRFSKSRTVSGSLGRIRLGLPRGASWTAKRFCWRFHQGFTEVPPRLHDGCASFVISLAFWGRSLSIPKGCAEGPPSLLYICLPVPSTLFCIFLNRVRFTVFSNS